MKCLSSDCFQIAWQWRRVSTWRAKSELMKVSVARGEGTGRCGAPVTAQPPSQPRIKHLSLSRCEGRQGGRLSLASLGSSADHWPGSDTWTLNTSGLGPGWLLSVRFLLLKFQIQNNKLRQELTHTPRREQNPDNRTRVTLVVKKPGICKVRFHAGIWSLFQFILEIIYQILHQIKTSLHELLTFQKPRVHLHPLCSVVWLGAGKNLNKTPTQIVTT